VMLGKISQHPRHRVAQPTINVPAIHITPATGCALPCVAQTSEELPHRPNGMAPAWHEDGLFKDAGLGNYERITLGRSYLLSTARRQSDIKAW
jgi:hypothetical protein